ncbi:signal peptidase I [Microbacterium sp. NPDC089189]|uniref:signal peptidase I n=1 Tax=Microbacterium sp. NPDC089189 TaxID=3154972 RepID=UPI0034142639
MSASTHRRPFRVLGSIILWILAPFGLLSALVWVGNTAGLVQPLVVVSGSMAPGIAVGDLLIAFPSEAGDLAVGDVATLPSPATGVLVTHRVVAVSRTGDTVSVRMKGDANNVEDAEDYVLAAEGRFWDPVLHLHGAGYAVMVLMRPAVAVPLVVGLLALVALSQMSWPRRSGALPGAGPEPELEESADTDGIRGHARTDAR